MSEDVVVWADNTPQHGQHDLHHPGIIGEQLYAQQLGFGGIGVVDVTGRMGFM